MLMKVLVINPGATSTKISAFDEEKEVMRVSISHSAQELSKFAHIAEQMPYRKKLILDALRENALPCPAPHPLSSNRLIRAHSTTRLFI